MSILRPKAIAQDDNGWLQRSQYWSAPASQKGRRGRRPRQVHEPLLLAGYGVRIWVDQDCLIVRDGFTHHPQELQERRYFPGDRTMPSRIVIIDAKGFLTLDAISWLADRGIPIIQLDWRGRVIVSINNPQSLSQTRIRAQIESQKHALRTASALIEAKFLNCIRTLHALPDSPHKTRAIDAHHHEIAALKKIASKNNRKIVGYRGIKRAAILCSLAGNPFQVERSKPPSNSRRLAFVHSAHVSTWEER